MNTNICAPLLALLLMTSVAPAQEPAYLSPTFAQAVTYCPIKKGGKENDAIINSASFATVAMNNCGLHTRAFGFYALERATLHHLVDALSDTVGVICIVTHGSEDGLLAQICDTYKDAADTVQKYVEFCGNSKEECAYVYQDPGAREWGVYATEYLFRKVSRPKINRMLFLAVCRSSGYLQSFQATWAAGLDHDGFDPDSFEVFWGRMQGQDRSAATRTAADAIRGTGFVSKGNGAFVLCPGIKDSSARTDSTTHNGDPEWILFTCEMDTSVDPVRLEPDIPSARLVGHWDDSRMYEFHLEGTSHARTSVVLDRRRARSHPAGIPVAPVDTFRLHISN